MKVVFLTNFDSGGAGSSVIRHYEMLQSVGVDCKIITQNKTIDCDDIYEIRQPIVLRLINRVLDRVRLLFFDSNYMFFDVFNLKKAFRLKEIEKLVDSDADFIILSWGARFVGLSDIFRLNNFNGKVLVHLVDMQWITGGCHYSYGCTDYTNGCSKCPAAKNFISKYIISSRFKSRARVSKRNDVYAFSPAKYILSQAEQSQIKFASVINNKTEIELSKFYFREKRNKLKYKTILMGSYCKSDLRKGYTFFRDSISLLSEILSATNDKVNILVPSNDDFSELEYDNVNLVEYDFATSDHELAMLYEQADVYVSPSLDDTGPAMLSETLCMGIPAVATRTGSAEELLSGNDFMGEVVDIAAPQQMADAIYKVLFSKHKLVPNRTIENQIKSVIHKQATLYEILKELSDQN